MDFAAARRTMIACQVRTSSVTDPLVIAALAAVPREIFVAEASRSLAYVDEELPVSKGRFLMEPAVLARLLQLAEVQAGDRALVVAAGSGYTAAVLSQMGAKVFAVDNDAAIVARSRQACADAGAAVTVVADDPRAGCPEFAPFDVIVIDGAVAAIPATLEQQLNNGGRLVAIVRHQVGHATLVVRAGAAFSRREDFDAHTPLLPEFTKPASFVF